MTKHVGDLPLATNRAKWIIAHIDAGKTMASEAILYRARSLYSGSPQLVGSNRSARPAE